MFLTLEHHHRLRQLARRASPLEVCGVITRQGKIIQLPNIAKVDPYNTFTMDLRRVTQRIAYIWHSHPGGDPDPSEQDLALLRVCPYGYLIVTSDEVASYTA